MRFWAREVLGWLLVLVGLGLFWPIFVLAREHALTELWAVTIFAIFVFRGGIHLLKVAVAARVCLEAQDRLYPSVALRPRPPAPPGPAALRGRNG
jgi:hypothetical protein